ncbi:MAG: NADH-quinone oxidoreductase subunit L [Thermodesulfobacteriota bacterium]
MLSALWLVPAFPLAGFLVLAVAGSRLPRSLVPIVGTGSVGIAAVISCIILAEWPASPEVQTGYTQLLWTWMAIGDFSPRVALHLDGLSLSFMVVVTVVGFLIHVYSVEYMAAEAGYARFFAYMNLFVAAMLLLVLADDLVVLYVGWEGVGLCSYLLIGFWYQEAENVSAANKAFVITRIGDTAMAIGLILLFNSLGTLEIGEILVRAPEHWPVGSGMAVLAAFLLLGGALGKSAQLPLQTWLPDAMAGPTPVSALIHAATMVTAGVYLVARTHVLFALAPPAQWAVAVIGVVTLLMAGLSALAQWDIKRVLAYSTISQIGYMFLALGVGAWSAAVFHFVTHACFKSLLFLAAGAVILSSHHEKDMAKLGGLRSSMPLVFITFLVGAASLAALPLVTGGFYSKDLILFAAWTSGKGGSWLWIGGVAGALITGVYSFRMVFLTFFGEAKGPIGVSPGLLMRVPIVALALLSIVVGFLQTPHTLGGVELFSRLLDHVFPSLPAFEAGFGIELALQVVAAAASILGIGIAYVFFLRSPHYAQALRDHPVGAAAHRLLLDGWKFDWLYDRVFLRPYTWVATVNRADLTDQGYEAVARTVEAFHRALSLTENGKIRQYAMGLAIGAVAVIGIMVLS